MIKILRRLGIERNFINMIKYEKPTVDVITDGETPLGAGPRETAAFSLQFSTVPQAPARATRQVNRERKGARPGRKNQQCPCFQTARLIIRKPQSLYPKTSWN